MKCMTFFVGISGAKSRLLLHLLPRPSFHGCDCHRVVTPCHSTAAPGRVMEGTRLTIQYKPPNGYEYTIRTPGTPTRWVHFEEELQWFWAALCVEMSKPQPEQSKHR